MPTLITIGSVSARAYGFGAARKNVQNIYITIYANTVSKITSAGVVTATWATVGSIPRSIVIDSSGNVYTANYNVGTVSKITPAGVVTIAWATVGAGTWPYGIAIDSSGNVYTANNSANTVSKITSAGVVTATWATVGNPPYGIAIY